MNLLELLGRCIHHRFPCESVAFFSKHSIFLFLFFPPFFGLARFEELAFTGLSFLDLQQCLMHWQFMLAQLRCQYEMMSPRRSVIRKTIPSSGTLNWSIFPTPDYSRTNSESRAMATKDHISSWDNLGLLSEFLIKQWCTWNYTQQIYDMSIQMKYFPSWRHIRYFRQRYRYSDVGVLSEQLSELWNRPVNIIWENQWAMWALFINTEIPLLIPNSPLPETY